MELINSPRNCGSQQRWQTQRNWWDTVEQSVKQQYRGHRAVEWHKRPCASRL